jgi:arylsulfatase A-like enzyme
MSDDLGYGDLSSYGAEDIRTPYIDGIGNAGVRFTDFYAGASVCTATRVSLMTARYPQRVAGLDLPLQAAATEARGLPATGRSLPRLLKNIGYSTALIGKWHLGYGAEYSPLTHGFDYFFGQKSAFGNYFQHINGAGLPDLWENDSAVSLEGHITDLITERAVAFMERNAGSPFFLDVSYSAPHVGRNTITSRIQYVQTVEHLDAAVGELLETIDRLGLAERTLIIFTNDNGGETIAHNGPLFHRKWTVWEGGIRVPTMITWPGQIPTGRVSDLVGITMDLTATVLAVAGVSDAGELDGTDLIPILTGAALAPARTLFWRSPDRRQLAARNGDWKFLAEAGGSFGPHVMLFNVREDPGERNDLSTIRSERLQPFTVSISAWLRDVTGDPTCGNIPRAVTGAC